MAEKIRDYIIKVPVYTTKCIECTEDELFGFTYHSMVETIKDNINNCFKPIHSSSRVKAKTSVINTVQCFDKNIEDRPCLLIRIATFNADSPYQGHADHSLRSGRASPLLRCSANISLTRMTRR